MRTTFVRSLLVIVAALSMVACDWFDDPSPENATVQLSGDAGEQVRLLLSKQFIAGINENRVTQVQIFQGDTLVRALPWDTVISIRIEQRFFIQSVDADDVDHRIRMQVLIDGDTEYDQSGDSSGTFQFVYTFNQPITSVIELI